MLPTGNPLGAHWAHCRAHWAGPESVPSQIDLNSTVTKAKSVVTYPAAQGPNFRKEVLTQTGQLVKEFINRLLSYQF